MKSVYIFLLLGGLFFSAIAQENPRQNYQLVKGKNVVQYKNFYLLTLFQQLPELSAMIRKDPVFGQFLKDKAIAVNEALKSCKTDISCYAKALKFNDEEIARVSNRLSELYTENNGFGKVVNNHLLPSGCYAMLATGNHKTLLIKAWEQDAKAINYTIGVYFEGNKPNYPKIDSISFSLKDKEFAELTATSATLAIMPENQLFFEPSMAFALEALELNNRNDAADFEPMVSTVNQAALTQIKKTDWKKYPYSVILVPGAGPEDRETELSAGGIMRSKLAAIQYKKGMAPFIVVSGGRVHPYKTKYSEALEMKKFLMHTMQIPESAIIMEPHARHTTTNLRNGVRLMFRYGMPVDKPGIISTTKSGIDYITNTLLERCKKELGYYPYKNGKRLSDTESVFYLNTNSLQIDFDEPLDP